MQLSGVLAVVVALLVPALEARAGTAGPGVGDLFEITRRYESSERSTDNASASSQGRDRLVERIVAAGDRGLELEYDLPGDATPEERARIWQFPARVLKPASGPMQLLNADDLEARVEAWRKKTGRTRAECERWIITSSALRITCDPRSVIEMLEAFDLRPADLRAGASYQDSDARGPGTLERKERGLLGERLVVEMDVDPDAIRRERAEADVAAGEMMRKPVTLEAALSNRAKEYVSGTISVTFDINAAGAVQRRRKVTRLETKRPDGHTNTKVTTEVVERRQISPRPAVP